MKKFSLLFLTALLCYSVAYSQEHAPLELVRTIKLPGVTGKFDHFAIDEKRDRLFAAAAGTHAVEVINLASGKVAEELGGFANPHGVAWIPESGRLFVSDGGKAELDVFEGTPLKLLTTIKLSEDADDMVYDPAHGLLYVGAGGTNSANPPVVAVVSTRSLELVTNISVDAHPEALDLDPGHDRIFANISDTGEIAIIDGASHTLAHKWTLDAEKGNTPLAYDAAMNRVLVGCRTPAKLLLLDGESGTRLDASASDAGADDLFYDEGTKRAYLITGSGQVDTYEVGQGGKLNLLSHTATAAGAKTGLFVPSQQRLFIGVPGTSGPAEIRVYETGKSR
jgi:hypothetical protein